jgi:hypothetical protein
MIDVHPVLPSEHSHQFLQHLSASVLTCRNVFYGWNWQLQLLLKSTGMDQHFHEGGEDFTGMALPVEVLDD